MCPRIQAHTNAQEIEIKETASVSFCVNRSFLTVQVYFDNIRVF